MFAMSQQHDGDVVDEAAIGTSQWVDELGEEPLVASGCAVDHRGDPMHLALGGEAIGGHTDHVHIVRVEGDRTRIAISKKGFARLRFRQLNPNATASRPCA
jgi:hypothetical protein